MLQAELNAFIDKLKNKPEKLKLNNTDKKVLQTELSKLTNKGDDFRKWKVANNFQPPTKSLFYFVRSLAHAKLCDKVSNLCERFSVLLEAQIQEQWEKSLKDIFSKTSFFAKPFKEKLITMNRDVMQIGFKLLRGEIDKETASFIISQDPKFEIQDMVMYCDVDEKNWICSLTTKTNGDLSHYITATIKQLVAEKDYWHVGKGEKTGSQNKKYKV